MVKGKARVSHALVRRSVLEGFRRGVEVLDVEPPSTNCPKITVVAEIQ
jgi:hypothetical protein